MMEFPDAFDIPFTPFHICENSWDISVIFTCFVIQDNRSDKDMYKVGLHMYEFCRFFLGVIFIYAYSQIELSKCFLIDM